MTKINLSQLELNKAYDMRPENPQITAVFLHGITADSSSFAKTFNYLRELPIAEKIRFVAYDLLGSGKSPSGDELNFGFEEQLAALNNSIEKLNYSTPLVLIGHSMGTLIATRYATKNINTVKQLILVSPPVYTREDLNNPEYELAMDIFKKVVAQKNPEAVESKIFKNEINLIVKNPENYQFLAQITVPTTLIYGELDEIIASFNIPKLLQENSKIVAIKTADGHGLSKEKNTKIAEILAEVLDA